MVTRGQKYLIVFRSIINDHDKILLLKRANYRDYNPGKWELPGGKLVAGEDIGTTAESIIERETNLVVKQTARRYYYQSRYVTEKGKYQGFTYIEITGEADYVAGEIKIGGDHQDSAWVDFKDVFKFNLSLESKKALTLYVSEIVDAPSVNEPGRIPVVLSARALITTTRINIYSSNAPLGKAFPASGSCLAASLARLKTSMSYSNVRSSKKPV